MFRPNNAGIFAASIFTPVLIAAVAAPMPAGAQQNAPTAGAPPNPTAAPVYVPTSLAPEPGLPRTPWGTPNLQDVVWQTNYLSSLESQQPSPLEVPEPAAKKIAQGIVTGFLNSGAPVTKLDPEVPDLFRAAEGLPIVRGKRRTRLVVQPANGKLPYTPEARAEVSKVEDPFLRPTDNPEERPRMERCLALLGMPPTAFTLSLNLVEFVQTPDQIVIHSDYGGEVRIVPFTDTHKPAMLRSDIGDSIARWEGDTLIVETIGLPASERIRALPTFIVESDAKVIERYTRLSEDELLYQFTVEDPDTYTRPWLAEYSYFRSDARIYPFACHEGNYSLPNILRAARVAEQQGG